MSTPIIDIRRPGPCAPRAAADAGTASKKPARRAAYFRSISLSNPNTTAAPPCLPLGRSGALRRRASPGSPRTLRSGRPGRNRGASGRGAARRAAAASSAVTAETPSPRVVTTDVSDSGPRLLAIATRRPARRAVRAIAWTSRPAPMIPTESITVARRIRKRRGSSLQGSDTGASGPTTEPSRLRSEGGRSRTLVGSRAGARGRPRGLRPLT
jgi:hypothetical protein